MRKTFLSFVFALMLFSATGQTFDTTKRHTYPYWGTTDTTLFAKKPLTIEGVKACITFQKSSEVYRSLSGLCDVWYSVAKQEGKTDEQAAEVALLNLGEKVKELIR